MTLWEQTVLRNSLCLWRVRLVKRFPHLDYAELSRRHEAEVTR